MYLPTPETLAALGFTVTEIHAWPHPCGTAKHPDGAGLSWWPAGGRDLRLSRRQVSEHGYESWPALHYGPVADEAAFRALVARHFPALAL